MAINKSTLDKFDLTGKTAVITGGGTGLGYAMSRGLLLLGAKVLIAARREDVLRNAAAKLKSECSTDSVLFHTVDLNDRDSVKAFADYAQRTLGGVDIFIGNAGNGLAKPVEAINDTELDDCVRVNFTANFELARYFLPTMRERRWGRILFSSSTSAILSPGALVGVSVYAPMKAAVCSLARTLAMEVSAEGVNVNALVLGTYPTDINIAKKTDLEEGMGHDVGNQYVEQMKVNTAVGRLGIPREVEGLVQLLATDAGSFITGQSIAVDGGMSSMIWANPPVKDPVIPKYCSQDI